MKIKYGKIKNDFINIRYFYYFKKSYVAEKPFRWEFFFFLIIYFLDTIFPDVDHYVSSDFKMIVW